nr:MAG TPA: hypothetical protein [Caudoviricetes sp.]
MACRRRRLGRDASRSTRQWSRPTSRACGQSLRRAPGV